MQIQGDKPVQGSEARRFSAGRAAPKEGAKSFASLLKQAGNAASPPPPAASVPVPPAPAPEAAAPPAPAAAPQASEAAPTKEAADAAFADHMEAVRFRLKTGYYASKAIDDALSEKLSGYFDDLA